MKLTDLVNLNEHVSSIKSIVDELASELKNSDEGKEANIKVSNTPASFEILIKDWGDVLDNGSSDYDEHKNHIEGERALNGIVNKFSGANRKIQFNVKYFDEGNYYHIDIKQKLAEEQDTKAPLEDATDEAIEAFKNSPHGKGVNFKTKKIKDGVIITAFDWGHWRENERGSDMSVSAKTEKDAADIIKQLRAKFEKRHSNCHINFDADLEDQSLVVTLKSERPATDFM